MEKEATQLIEKIASSSGRQPAAIRKLIKEKKGKFSGLLTDSGAAFMVARELGIDLGLESGKEKMTISKLQDGMQNVDLLVRVMHVFAPKTFERNGKKGKLCSLIVADKTGETRLTLWHNDVQLLRESGVERGSILLLHNCYVRSFNDKPQLNLSYNGSFTVNPKGVLDEELPKARDKQLQLSELGPDMNDVSAVVRVLRLFPANEFEKDDRKGRVMNFLVGDGKETIRATAWNDLVKEVETLHENDLIKVEGAYTKQGMQGVELHLGWRSRIVANPKTDAEIPSAAKMLQEKAERRKLSELGPGNELVAVEAAIVAVNQGRLHYSVCPKCMGKVQQLDEGFVCGKCGEVKKPDQRPVVSIRLDDGSGQINAVAYGGEAERIIGLGKEELVRQVESSSAELLIQQLQPKLVGKQLRAVGKARENAFSSELELIVRSVELV